MSNEAIKMAGDGQPMPAQPVGGKLPTELSLDEFSAASYEKWKEEATAALKGASFDKSMYTGTYEGIQLEPLYTKDHVKEALFAETRPGVWPMRGSCSLPRRSSSSRDCSSLRSCSSPFPSAL